MGQSKSKTSVPEATIDPQVEVIGTKRLGYFGEVEIAKEKDTGAQLYVKKFNFYNREEFEKQLAHCYLRQNNPHPNLINIIGYKSVQEAVFCSEHYSITVYLEVVEDTLEEKLVDHIQNNTFISEIELQLLGEQLVSILAQSQMKEIAHGDIRPGTLFFTEEAYKLADSTFNELNGAAAFIRQNAGGSLLAPEVLKSINGENEPAYNKYKADVFSLGATLLSLATLTKSEELYNIMTNEIDVQLLEQRIVMAENLYSKYFTSFLRTTLEMEPAARPDFCQLVGKFNIADALQNYHLKKEYQNIAAKAPLVKIARTILVNPDAGYYAALEQMAVKHVKQSHAFESPEKQAAPTQHATPNDKFDNIQENREKVAEPEILRDTPVKSSQVIVSMA